MNHPNEPLLPAFLDFAVYPLQDDPTALDLQGQNARHTLIVVMKEAYDEPSANFLAKVLAAVEYELERDTLLLLLSAHVPAASWMALQSSHTIRRVLFFGVSPQLLGLSLMLRPYTAVEWYGVEWLSADALPKLSGQRTLKGALWVAMKPMFLGVGQ